MRSLPLREGRGRLGGWGGWGLSRGLPAGAGTPVAFFLPRKPGPCDTDQESALMEAEEPPHRASTPTTTLENLHVFPTSLMKNSCIPGLDPEAAETDNPAWEWTEDDDDVFGAQRRDLSSQKTTEETPPTLSQEDSPALEPDSGDVVTAESSVWRPSGLASQGLKEVHTPFLPTESSVLPTLVESLGIGYIPDEISSNIGLKYWSEFLNSLMETERSEASNILEKGIFLPSSTQARSYSPPEEPSSLLCHDASRTVQQEGKAQDQERKENGGHQRQEKATDTGKWWKQKQWEREQRELEWNDALSGKQALDVVTCLHGPVGEQGQEDKGQFDLVVGKQKGETFNREVKDQNHREGYQGEKDAEKQGHGKVEEQKNQENEFLEEQGKVDHYDTDQVLDEKQKIVNVGKENQGTIEKQSQLEEEAKKEQGNVAEKTEAEEIMTSENDKVQKHYGPFPLISVVPDANVSWNSFPEDPVSTVTRSITQEGIKTESSRVELSMYSSCPDSASRPRQGASRSYQPIPPHNLSGKYSEKEADQNGWEEECGLGDGAMPNSGKKPTPPRPIAIVSRKDTSTSFSSTKKDPNTTTSSSSCPPTFPIGDSLLPSYLSEFPRSFSFEKEFPFDHWDPDSPLNILPLPSSGETPLAPHGNSDWANALNVQDFSEETIQYYGSNSAPSSYREGQSYYLAQNPASFQHSELAQRVPEPSIHSVDIPGREGQARLEPSSDPSSLNQPQELNSNLQRPDATHSKSPPKKEALISGGLTIHDFPPSSSMVEMGLHERLPPLPLRERHSHPPLVVRPSIHLAKPPTPKRYSHPPILARVSPMPGSPEGPSIPVKARHNRPLPSTPVTDTSHHIQTPRLRYNKPLPPTPIMVQPYYPPTSTTLSKKNKPLPPVPILEPDPKPPPLPPKAKWRNNSIQGTPGSTGDQLRSKPGGNPEVPSPLSAGHASWPPAVDRPTDSLTSPGRNKRETSSLAFSNMTNFLLLSPSSSASSMTQEPQHPILGGVQDEHGQSEGTKSLPKKTLSKGILQREGSGSRRSDRGLTWQSEKPSHPPLEKASSWPHRKDPGKFLEGSRGHSESPAEGQNKTKGWNRQGLRRPSIFPGEVQDGEASPMDRPLCPSDTTVLQEKKSREGMGSVARRCSKFINSSHLLYQEYSDVALNKEIQSQQRLDSLSEVSSPASPPQPRKSPVIPDSYLQRLSIASSASLWQDIPRVRNSTMLLSMTHENQKLQEAKFELIMSEASYLRSLHVAVDHFQLSPQLRATLSNQEHQWLFSRLQDVRDVSTTFLSDLEENFEHNIFTFHVCDVVLTHAPAFRRVYLPYVTNQTYQERTFQTLLSSNNNFREVLEKLESDPICQRLSLKSFLILPFQRITRLKLLLQNILKRTQPGSPEEAEATEAHHVLEELIRDCNNNVQRMRRTEELIYLSQKIEFECRFFPLISQSRWLVKSGELTALESNVLPGLRRKLATRPVHLHLFNDFLLLSRPREGNRFLVFDHSPFSSIRGEKCEMKLHGPHKNFFRLFLRNNAHGTGAEYLFRTETQSEKLRWISALTMPREELDLLECQDYPQVQCLRSYKPRENDELALEKADVVMVTQQSSDGWLEGVRLSDGERGWFPLSHVEFITNSDVRKRNLSEALRVKTAKLQLVGRQR